jgi:hypothetical protein
MNSERSGELLHTAFFVSDFRFSDEQRGEFKLRGFTDSVVAALEAEVSHLKGFYDTGPPNPREQKKRLQALHRAFTECSNKLAAIDDLTASVLAAHAGLTFWDLRKTIDVYRDAARKAVDGVDVPEFGPEATKATHIAIVVGKTLRQFEIDLNDEKKGPFVTATEIIFEALGIAKADSRNDVRRARQVIDNSIR